MAAAGRDPRAPSRRSCTPRSRSTPSTAGPGFTMDGVARRAGFGKSTLYLRWPDKDALLTDAVRLRSRTVAEVDTGSLRGDLTGAGDRRLPGVRRPRGLGRLPDGRRQRQREPAAGPVHPRAERGAPRGHRGHLPARAGPGRADRRRSSRWRVTDLIYGAGLFFALGRRLDHRAVDRRGARRPGRRRRRGLLDGLD